jgi:hypothetical protein
VQINNGQLLNFYNSQQHQIPKHYAKRCSVCVFQVGSGGGIHIGMHLTIHNHWYMTQILMVTFLPVISLTLLCMITAILWERTTSYITSKGVQSELKDEDNGEGYPRLQQRCKFWEWRWYLHCTSGAKNMWVQKTIGFIRSLVTDKMPSPIRHDSSEKLPLLDCVCVCACAIKTTNRDLQLSPHVSRFKLRLWWTN